MSLDLATITSWAQIATPGVLLFIAYQFGRLMQRLSDHIEEDARRFDMIEHGLVARERMR